MRFHSVTGKICFGVAILAAGASSRMGRPKMLLPWGGSTVLGHLIEQWRGIGAMQVAVVCAADDLRMAAELDQMGVLPRERVFNPEPARGMFSSIQCAARWNEWNAALTHVVIALGDQPHLTTETLRKIITFAAAHPQCICQPAFNGRARHPVFIPLTVFRALTHTTAGTLKEFLAAHASMVRPVECHDPGLEIDLDTPADYEQAQKRFLGGE